jgi:hypothetical protein
MQNALCRRTRLALLCVALATGPGTAFAQSGSAGGSIGNDEKSLSGTRSAEPERPARRSKPEAQEPRRAAPRRSSGGGGGGGGNFDGAWVANSVGTPCGSATQAIVVTSGRIIGDGLSEPSAPAAAPVPSAITAISPSSVPAVFPAAPVPERSSDRTAVSEHGLCRNNKTVARFRAAAQFSPANTGLN